MKIAILSDTHGNTANFKKIVAFLNQQGIGLILHCGDIGSPESLKESLADFKGNFLGVLGNMDKDWIDLSEYQNPPKIKVEKETLETEIAGQKIAVIHRPESARRLAESGRYDLVFYGHTHQPWEEKIGNCRMINPGEVAGQFYKPSFAIYDTETGKLELMRAGFEPKSN